MSHRLIALALASAAVLSCGRFDSRATGEVDPLSDPSLGAAEPLGVHRREPGPVLALAIPEPGAPPMSAPAGRPSPPPAGPGPSADRLPNELGLIPILEYHLIGDAEGRWQRQHERFRADLELLYRRGYRPVTLGQLVDRDLDLPAGLSPVVFTFDDASPSQFRYVEHEDGRLEIDPTSAVGIWLAFSREHPDWENKAVFCLLSGAEAGRSFFGDKGIEGQKTKWRFSKLRFLAEQGFELCNHTLWHANLSRYEDSFVQEQIARGVMAIDSAVPGYRVRSFSLPLGAWPKNRDLAHTGSWTEPRTGRVVGYSFDVVLEVAGGPARSPHDPQFDPRRLPRVQVYANELERMLDHLDRSGTRYVSDGDPRTVARLIEPAVGTSQHRGASAADARARDSVTIP
ncbi:MAG TPA: polysaccharide deacetylase family protein [Gemmatimonadaceae bacterium]|nr:polysaccharide deacetylase family protein [Gemmatimonadaceae bacterium]